MWIFTLIACNNAHSAVLILARGGSKGVRLKNLQNVGGKSLIQITADIARSAGLDDITVSTDHPLIALEAYKHNVSVLHRSSVTASDGAPSIWGAAEFLHQRRDIEILVLMQATSPFVKPLQLRGALTKLQAQKPYDCIFSVTRSHKLRWQMAKTKLYPVNFDATKRPRRQDWDGEFVETGSFYIARRPLIEEGHFQNNNAVCELPPKRVVVGGGSEDFLSQRREALQRWLSLTARHPVMAHDADLRTFLCDLHLKLDRPRHDEFLLAGTTDTNDDHKSTEDIETAFQGEMEELRLMQLGLTRLAQIFERARKRVESERADIRELGAGLAALSTPAHRDLHAAASLARSAEDDSPGSEGNGVLELALDALSAYRMLCARLTRGLHGERAAAARHQATATASLRARHRYALRAAEQEGSVARAYAVAAVEAAAQALGTRGAAHARLADLWAQLHAAATLNRGKELKVGFPRGPIV